MSDLVTVNDRSGVGLLVAFRCAMLAEKTTWGIPVNRRAVMRRIGRSKAAEVAREVVARELGSLTVETLWRLHSSYVQRYLADNERIWSTASLLVPLALAAFPLLVTLDEPSWRQSVVFGAASISVMYLWLAIANAHKAYQNRSYHVIRAIESLLIGGAKETTIRTALNIASPDPIVTASGARWGLMIGTVGGWAVLTILLYRGLL